MSVFTLKDALKQTIKEVITEDLEPSIQETPPGKAGDFSSAIAFQLAKIRGQNPIEIAKDLAQQLKLPNGIAKVELAGPYLNFFVEHASFVQNTVESFYTAPQLHKKVIIEHSSVNPNKEWHVGHIRGCLLGDSLARIYRAAGYQVEVQNYIDDTGRQAAESLFAADFYQGDYAESSEKFDRWLGEFYVRLHKDLENTEFKAKIEPGVTQVIKDLEHGLLREKIEQVVKAHLETAQNLGVEYDLLVWESDIVQAGFVDKALHILEKSEYVFRPSEGKYAGALVFDLGHFVPGLEEPLKVLVRSNGTFVYELKDIANQYWKFGLFEGLNYQKFSDQITKELWTSHPEGENKHFAQADRVINVIDIRQSLAQTVVQAALQLTDEEKANNSIHLAFETVLLEGKAMSGRKGLAVAADDVIAEAKTRALSVVREKNPNLENAEAVAKQVGIGALRFAFLRAEPTRQIDFRFDQALALVGDTAPVVQYAHARACSILRKAKEIELKKADWSKIGPLEVELTKTVIKLPEVIATCLRENSPHAMAAYTIELANAFNSYYNHKTDGKADTPVLTAAEGLREARLLLVGRVAKAIEQTLALLGIAAPEEM